MSKTTLAYTEGMNVEVTMLPVSAGDATLLVWSDGRNKHTVLIDAGLHEHEAISYLQSVGIFHLDLIILSHPDLDHLGGLPAIMNSRAMSVDKIWCFDLNFLREYIRTGKIPSPQPATREVAYDYLLRSTLDQFSDILKSANGRGVQILQVSEGYRLSLGGMLLEVLYPPQSFYHALGNPITLKQLLRNRKWPDDWSNQSESDGETEGKARPLLSHPEQRERLTKMGEKPDMPEGGFLLSDIEEAETELPESAREGETIPWRMVGTLYNNMSIVVKVNVLGGINSPTLLFPGDLSDWTTLVLRQWHNLRAEILKMPHHGSKRIGFNVEAFYNEIDHFHWHYLWCKRHCQGCLLCEPWSHTDWRLLDNLIHIHDFVDLLQELVKPSHILVFPYPQHKLPNTQLTSFDPNVIANRVDRRLHVLSQSGNEPCAARILVGLERDLVEEVRL